MPRRDSGHRSPRRAPAPAEARPAQPAHALDRYLVESRRPLHILLFVTPLIVLYEIGLLLLLPGHPDVLPNLAHEGLLRFFAIFGVGFGLLLPGLVLFVVLLVWQVLSGEPWRPRWSVPLLMALEGVLASMPLLVVGQLAARALPAAGEGLDQRIAELDLAGRMVVSLGAGLFEELVFRMLLIAVLHTVLVDVAKASDRVGSAVAIAVSAAFFTAYHPLAGPHGGLSIHRLVFFALAGIWFGVLFVTRGFGIAVGAHVAYDAVVAGWLLD